MVQKESNDWHRPSKTKFHQNVFWNGDGKI